MGSFIIQTDIKPREEKSSMEPSENTIWMQRFPFKNVYIHCKIQECDHKSGKIIKFWLSISENHKFIRCVTNSLRILYIVKFVTVNEELHFLGPSSRPSHLPNKHVCGFMRTRHKSKGHNRRAVLQITIWQLSSNLTGYKMPKTQLDSLHNHMKGCS